MTETYHIFRPGQGAGRAKPIAHHRRRLLLTTTDQTIRLRYKAYHPPQPQ